MQLPMYLKNITLHVFVIEFGVFSWGVNVIFVYRVDEFEVSESLYGHGIVL